MNQPLQYSIVIPVYNRERFIERAVKSVLNQSVSDLEVICVNNGSTDGTLALLRKMAGEDDRVIVLDQENKGRCAARNLGLDHAAGEWICFLDSDDFYYPIHLETFDGAQRQQPEALAFASTLVHNHALTDQNQTNRLDGQFLELSHFIRANPISLIQLCVHKSLVSQLRFHEDDLPMAEDWLYIREIALQKPIWKFNQETVEVGEHDERSMNTMDLERIAYYNIKTSELFTQRNTLDQRTQSQVLGRGYMLATHIYLQANNKAKAARSLIAAMRHPFNWLRYSWLWAVIKLILPSSLIQNESK